MKSYLIIMVIIVVVVVATHFIINGAKRRKWVLRRNRFQIKITLIHTRLSQRATRSRPLCPPSAVVLICVNESSRCPFAELFGFVGQGDLYNTRDMPRRSLHTDGVRSNQLVGDIWGEKNPRGSENFTKEDNMSTKRKHGRKNEQEMSKYVITSEIRDLAIQLQNIKTKIFSL